MTRISHEGGSVRIETERGSMRAKAVIVTVSTNVLASGAIAFDVAADDHLHAASRLPLGLADKLFIGLLDGHGFEPDTHLLGDPHDPRTGSYYVMPFGRSVIEGFYGGPDADAVEDVGPARSTSRSANWWRSSAVAFGAISGPWRRRPGAGPTE